ncbi:restriction endonuclease subunit S [Escherichia fergusonii]|nr:restriction endonuclease subunit S [Escherichia fergusonii]WGA65599.1 restriction endonuclease subunit S [Escherichia fergusonii]
MKSTLYPSDWGNASLEEVSIHIIGGDWGKDPDFIDQEYESVACIRGAEFKNWKRDFGKTAVIRKVKCSSLSTRNLLENDILVEISGGGPDQPVGRTVLIDEKVLNQHKLPLVCTNFLRLVRLNNNINAVFVNRYLEFFYNSGEVTKYQSGSNNLRNLKFKDYSALKMPLPPLAEQKIIAEKLDTLLAQVDSTKARLEQIPQILKRFRQAVLAAAVSGKLTEPFRTNSSYSSYTLALSKDFKNIHYADSWERHQLKDCCTVISGNAFKSSAFTINKDIPVIKISNIQYGEFEIKNQQYLPQEYLDKYGSFKVTANDILMALTRPITNDQLKVCRYPDTQPVGLLNQRVCKFIFNKDVNTNFFELLFQSEYFKAQVSDNLSETLQPNLSPNDLKKFTVFIPPLPEQAEIVRRVEQLFAYADTIEKQVNNALARVNKLTQSILAKAFRGELTAQWRAENPDLISGENSAAALLEKIKAERAASGGKKASRKKS